MNRDQLVGKIVAAFRRLEQEILQRGPAQGPQSDAPWTKEILITLCNLGRNEGYESWATNRIPDEYRDGGEFLYDASWRESDCSCRIISFPNGRGERMGAP